MNRFLTALALSCACVIATQAQEAIKSKTIVKGGKGRTVTYTGCVLSGPESQSFRLENAVPMAQQTTTTQTAGTTGVTTTTTTTYSLVPNPKVELQPQVGHKVEVTGILMPSGKTKTETKTTIKNEHAPDTTIRERAQDNSSMPEFRVLAMKRLADTCN